MEDLKGWKVDLRRLYGWWGWRRRAEFSLAEEVYEAPAGDACVVLYHIGEIGLAGMVGHIAVFKDKRSPRRVYSGGWMLYWYQGEETVRWSGDGGRAFLYEYVESDSGHGRRRREIFLTVLDLKRERWARVGRGFDGFPTLSHVDEEVFTVDASPETPDKPARQVHFKRLNWMRFRWFWW